MFVCNANTPKTFFVVSFYLLLFLLFRDVCCLSPFLCVYEKKKLISGAAPNANGVGSSSSSLASSVGTTPIASEAETNEQILIKAQMEAQMKARAQAVEATAAQQQQQGQGAAAAAHGQLEGQGIGIGIGGMDIELTKEEIERQDKLARTIYVGNLNPMIGKEHVEDFFSVCGKIEITKLAGNASQPAMARYAFVEFQSVESARAAYRLSGLFGYILFLFFLCFFVCDFGNDIWLICLKRSKQIAN